MRNPNKKIKEDYVNLYKAARSGNEDSVMEYLSRIMRALGHGSIDDYLSSLYVTDRTLYRLCFNVLIEEVSHD